MTQIEDFFDWLADNRWAEQTFSWGALIVVAVLSYYLAKAIAGPIVRRAIKRSAITWDDVLFNEKALSRLELFVPLMVITLGTSALPGISADSEAFIDRFTGAAFMLTSVITISAFMGAAGDLYGQSPMANERPIKGYLQLGQIFLWLVGAGVSVALLSDRSPWFFISGLGAMMAVVLLIFRDTILSFVASIQLTQNDMLKVGDWIEMPQAGVDGDVMDIALHTVKVRNFDKTIVTVPTQKLINESFKNWRGMSESGGRRIKRSINIDISSIRFLTDEESERFGRFEPLKDYIDQKRTELADQPAAGDDTIGDPRRLTNVGTFRAYAKAYTRAHPRIDSEGMTFLVRQLAPGATGLPMEIYVFANDTDWIAYEEIQADIFDHLLAMIPAFGLRTFQEATGADITALGGDEARVMPEALRAES